jgi:oligoribonuclease (3'-5' exoribonuclease)
MHVDTETTGIDYASDQIIDVGMIALRCLGLVLSQGGLAGGLVFDEQ